MKKLLIIILPILFFTAICLVGCKFHKRTEAENRKIAQAYFERYCRMIRYETNEFTGPVLTIGNVDTNNLSYSYIWKDEAANVSIGVVIDESGEIAGGPGRLDYNRPLAPFRPPKQKNETN
jgi:hypothetical protein